MNQSYNAVSEFSKLFETKSEEGVGRKDFEKRKRGKRAWRI
jgi:hypothetical protein